MSRDVIRKLQEENKKIDDACLEVYEVIEASSKKQREKREKAIKAIDNFNKETKKERKILEKLIMSNKWGFTPLQENQFKAKITTIINESDLVVLEKEEKNDK